MLFNISWHGSSAVDNPQRVLHTKAMMRDIVWFLGGYLVGGIPFGLILSRTIKGVDPRTVGSGNIGATNVIRAAGPVVGILTGILDIAKALVPVLLAKLYVGPELAIWMVLAAVLGHCFTPYLGFRGGKGVASAFGAFIAFDIRIAALAFAVWLVFLLVFRYVSLASLAAALTMFLSTLFLYPYDLRFPWVAFAVALVIWLRHHSNIRRLLQGVEPRVGQKKA